jgi:chromosome segregation protein
MRDKVNDLKLQLASLKERLDLEFKISIDDLMEQEPGAELNKEDLNEKVGRMKNRLENFGEINPFAVEAFNEMKQRADFIVTQKNDLVTAKESLMNTIDEIESKAREQFMEAFNQVKENFVNVFRNLFTAEDTCDLILSNPDSPLESSIDIIAKPKGKRPQTINQLSGGEKTLTAISLLFALYLLKPAPFCVLDEVDAPLDDANVGKFTDIIRQFSDKSQFILVTHNKQTMASVDVIYGVTMQEEGVSKVVPVDFRQLQEAEAV